MKKPRKDRQRLDELRVHLSRRVLDLIKAECAATERETGGLLVGHVREEGGSLTYEVTHATPPGPDSSLRPCHFVRGSGFAKRRLDFLATKFGVGYLGEWHKHPVSGTPQASSTDRATMRDIACKTAYDIEQPILVIANETGHRLAIYAADRRKVDLICVQPGAETAGVSAP